MSFCANIAKCLLLVCNAFCGVGGLGLLVAGTYSFFSNSKTMVVAFAGEDFVYSPTILMGIGEGW